MEFKKVIKKTYTRVEPKSDYLKYWRIVRIWAREKHGLSYSDLEMLLFLHSERLFNKSKFVEFNKMMSWDNVRWARLYRDGWISKWRERMNGEASLYEVSLKGRNLIKAIYKKLEGEQTISESPSANPMFQKRNDGYAMNRDKKIIRKMNRTRKEKKRLAELEEQAYQQQPHVIKRRKEITPYLEYKKQLKEQQQRPAQE
jgi:hypothetical protein